MWSLALKNVWTSFNHCGILQFSKPIFGPMSWQLWIMFQEWGKRISEIRTAQETHDAKVSSLGYKEEKLKGPVLSIKHRNTLTRTDGGVAWPLELWEIQSRSSVWRSKTPLTEESMIWKNIFSWETAAFEIQRTKNQVLPPYSSELGRTYRGNVLRKCLLLYSYTYI